jgi:hypothetical protein
MRFSRITSWIALLGTLAIPACSRDQPSAPGLHAVSGRVRLTGSLVDANAHFSSTRVLDAADGVPVQLVRGNRVVDHTTTVSGVYHFAAVSPGSYLARVRVIGDLGDDTRPITVAGTDLVVADTIKVLSSGDLYPVPNPMGQSTTIYFEVPDTERVDVRILDLSGNTVLRLLAQEFSPGLHLADWDGFDSRFQQVSGPAYWVTFQSGSDVRAHLLFR